MTHSSDSDALSDQRGAVSQASSGELVQSLEAKCWAHSGNNFVIQSTLSEGEAHGNHKIGFSTRRGVKPPNATDYLPRSAASTLAKPHFRTKPNSLSCEGLP